MKIVPSQNAAGQSQAAKNNPGIVDPREPEWPEPTVPNLPKPQEVPAPPPADVPPADPYPL